MNNPTPRPAPLPRSAVALLTIAAIGVLVTLDLAATGLPDPMSAPLPTALGSGQAPGGAHCSAQ